MDEETSLQMDEEELKKLNEVIVEEVMEEVMEEVIEEVTVDPWRFKVTSLCYQNCSKNWNLMRLLTLVIHFESHEIQMESHEIHFESHEIPLESHEIHSESHEIHSESHEIQMYNMKFVPFIGIDNHGKCVTLGSGMLLHEDTQSYTWLLTAFMSAFLKEPTMIIPVISLKSQMIYVESHEILFESHEILFESHEIQSESHEIQSESHEIHFEPHKIRVESHVITGVNKIKSGNLLKIRKDLLKIQIFDQSLAYFLNLFFAGPAYVHKDINSSNILLSKALRAKISKFGLARLSDKDQNGNSSIKCPSESKGYLAPEYLETGFVTTKTDVYAFGVVLLELITGRKAVYANDDDGKEVMLSEDVLSVWGDEKHATDKVSYLIDPRLQARHPLGFVIDQDELTLRMIRLAIACLEPEPSRRLCVNEIVSTLMRIQMDAPSLETTFLALKVRLRGTLLVLRSLWAMED
ncbi:LysM domain receptor-like kinase 4 [Tanacetum coccineum]|uniref:LysM domain receptor-like kinase 4 n=1 Tax=Tanacetum coccineum TaxID=301880 RepID=A0ABQ5HAG8_9ASTR